MRGDNLRIRRYLENYGYDFVMEAIETAIDLKNAREMSKKRMGMIPTVSRNEGEVRILDMAKKMNIRIGGSENERV